jgi:hypothetical protein
MDCQPAVLSASRRNFRIISPSNGKGAAARVRFHYLIKHRSAAVTTQIRGTNQEPARVSFPRRSARGASHIRIQRHSSKALTNCTHEERGFFR